MNTNALENMKTRRSCRVFLDHMPDRELIRMICEAGTYAPTGHGKQSPLIVAVTNHVMRDRLADMNARIWNELTARRGGTAHAIADPFYGAPVILLVLADRSVPTYLYDGCAVLTNMANAAHACGLDSCWIHRAKEEFNSPEGRAILHDLGIEGDYEGIAHLAVGYRAKDPAPAAPRKDGYIRWVE